MATQPKAAGPDVVGQIVLLRPDEIDASDRMRPLDPLWVEALAGILKAEGQRTPVEVCRLPGKSGYRLITGGHRHAAAAKNEMYLRAEIVTNDVSERRLREISENLHRLDLAPLDRANFVAELVAVHKARAGLAMDQDGRTASINARWQKALQAEAEDTTETISIVYGWTDRVAELVGVTARTVRNDLLLVRRIPASIIDALRRADHPVLRNAGQLRGLAKLDDGTQRKVLGLLLHHDMQIAGAPFASVSAAVAALSDRTAPSPDAKRLSAFVGTFGRMGLAEKKGALRHLSGMLPAGWNLFEGDAAPHADQLRAALSVAFDVVAKLSAGDPVDDDEIEAARAMAQGALFDCFTGTPKEQGEKA